MRQYEERDLKCGKLPPPLRQCTCSQSVVNETISAKHAIPTFPQPPYSPDFTPLNSASKSEKGCGRGALCKGTILKGIIFSKLYAERDIIYRKTWGTF
jgi:hypothetical protein